MHELSICGSIADIATRHAAGRAVRVINVRAGQLPYLGFDMDGFRANLRKVNPVAEVMLVSARTGEGIDAWCD